MQRRRGGEREDGEEPEATGAEEEEAPQVVRVRRELLAGCMTCPLCHKLLRDATTISECLHTFCRKCIFEKLKEEDPGYCPVCNIDLGPLPLEKLRPDHSLQDIRSKIFPFKRRKVDAPETVSSISLPVRRKERSLSSLVVTTPHVVNQTGLTGRRTKAVARRAAALHGLGPSIAKSTRREDDHVEKHAETSSACDTLSNMTHNRRQHTSNADSSNQTPNRDTENGGDSFMDKSELWKPLNCLVEAVNRKTAPKSSTRSAVVKAEQINGSHSEFHIPKTNTREASYNSKVQDSKSRSVSMTLASGKVRRLRGTSHKRKRLTTSSQVLSNAGIVKCERRINPVWLSLIAAAAQEGDAQLPQISASYLRIKDGNLPVAFIQKYIVKKLDLRSEADVEILCRGQPVGSTMAMHDLIALWLQRGSSQRVQASVGTSAKNFVMVLSYGRRKPAP